jgi:hypothetical protein
MHSLTPCRYIALHETGNDPKPDVGARRFWRTSKPETHLFSTETCSMALL